MSLSKISCKANTLNTMPNQFLSLLLCEQSQQKQLSQECSCYKHSRGHINCGLYHQEGHTKHIFKQFHNIHETKRNKKKSLSESCTSV